MVIADDLHYADFFAAQPGVEATLTRPVDPNLMTRAEWQRKRGEPDSFANRIASQRTSCLLKAQMQYPCRFTALRHVSDE